MQIFQNKSLKSFTTFKIGGKAKYFIAPKTLNELRDSYLFAKENNLKVFVLGKGSNVLFSDEGFEGIVIFNNIKFLRFSKTNVYVGAGYSFSSLGIESANRNLAGLEYAMGIPASVGGAIYMNASSYKQTLSDVIERVIYLDEDGRIKIFEKDQLEFSYRSSVFQKKRGIIFSACFKLKKDKRAKKRQLEMFLKKRKSQPLNKKNAGCIFRNKKRFSAGKLIEECGLKNYKIGKAKVSNLHANFIINEKDASSKDVLDLISHIKYVVKMKKNILLTEEIKIITP
jgi:UDP-N-acetylmuramate dehydrogenase